MMNLAKLRRTRLFAVLQCGWRIGCAVFVALLMTPAFVLAHGGMSTDEVGPPIVTSGLIGFVSYWVVMLWPSAKKKGDPKVGIEGKDPSAPRIDRHISKRPAHLRRTPRLRKIEGRSQFSSDQNTRRRASDG